MRPFLVAVLLSTALTPSAARAADRRLPVRALLVESKGQEGNSGQVVAPVTITQSPGNSATTYAYRTIDGTATAADNDYVPLNGVLTIPAGQTTGKIDVQINGDTKVEGDETFTLEVDGVVNGSSWATVRSAVGSGWWDRWIVDGLVRFIGGFIKTSSWPVRLIETGYTQNYALVMILGVLIFVGYVLWGTP